MWYWEIDSNFLKREKMELKNNAFLTKYSAGAIVSRKKYHYGYYEIRFKVEEGRGIWPAFWFFGGEKNEEIDGFELKGEKNNQIHVDTHCPSGCDRGYKNNLGFNTNWGGWLPVTKQLHEGFNVMGLEWKQDELIWYLNGFPLAYFKGRFPNPMNLYLNTSVAKDGGPFKPGPDETTVWPNTYTVDYLRIWQPVAANTRIPLQQNENYVCSTEPAYKNMAVTRRKRGYMYKKREFGKTEGLVYLSHPSPGQLTIDVLGRLREAGTTIRLTAKNTDQTFTNFDQQIVAPLGKDDRELTLTVSTKKRQYTCTILLAD